MDNKAEAYVAMLDLKEQIDSKYGRRAALRRIVAEFYPDATEQQHDDMAVALRDFMDNQTLDLWIGNFEASQ